jgi:imidazolonepropionase-like amidohydrolase
VPQDLERVDALALTGARIYCSPEATVLVDATIVTSGDAIASIGRNATIPPGTKTLDCRGRTIVAGLWNSHVHFHERKWSDAGETPAVELARQLQELTRYGFTTLFDLSSRWENTQRLRDRIESKELPGPRILSTGEGLIPAGGVPSVDVFRTMGIMDTTLLEIDGPATARAACATLVGQSVDAIKIFVSSPAAGALSPATIRAAVEVAHDAGKQVFAHPNTADDVAAALEGEVDVIAHTTPRSGAWDRALVERMRARDVALTPTLFVWESFLRHDRLSLSERMVEIAVDQLRVWLAAGGTTLFGTDLGAVEYDPTREYELMERAGASFPQILASLTTEPAARFFGDPSGATIAAGRPADLAVLDGDPADAIVHLSNVRYTIRRGEVVYAKP